MSSNGVTIQQADMQFDYYEINPRQHSEAAYQPKQGDKFPPVPERATTAGPAAVAVVMVTSLYNKGASVRAEMQLVDHDSLQRFNGGTWPTPEQAQQIIQQHPEIVAGRPSGMTPFIALVNVEPNSRLVVRPLTGGTQAKAVSLEDYRAKPGRPPV